MTRPALRVGQTAAFITALALLAPRADAALPDMDTWFLLPGVDIGFTGYDARLGVEVSLTYLHRSWWWYGIVSSASVLGSNRAISLGGQLGHEFIGVELGARIDEDRKLYGRLRGCLTIGYGAIYAGGFFSPLIDHDPGVDVGILLKFPIDI